MVAETSSRGKALRIGVRMTVPPGATVTSTSSPTRRPVKSMKALSSISPWELPTLDIRLIMTASGKKPCVKLCITASIASRGCLRNRLTPEEDEGRKSTPNAENAPASVRFATASSHPLPGLRARSAIPRGGSAGARGNRQLALEVSQPYSNLTKILVQGNLAPYVQFE